MTTKSNTFMGGTNGSTITTANSGGVSGDPFYWALIGAGGALTYDITHAAHGALSAKVVCTASTATYVGYTTTASARLGVRAYFYLTALPTADQWLLVAYAANTSTRLMTMMVESTGRLRFHDASGAGLGVWKATNPMPLNQWVRVEFYGSCGSTTSNSTVKAGVYLGDSTTPIEAIYSTTTGNLGVASQFGIVKAGHVNASVYSTPFWVDDILADDAATGLLGPVVTAIVTNSQANAAIVTATGTAAAGGTLAYSIAQTSGTTTTPLLISTGKWAIPRHVTDTLTYTVTVTESPSGLTGPSTVNVTPQGATGGDAVMIRNATNSGWL